MNRKLKREYRVKDGSTIKLESSWEIDLANWLDQQHIEWIRPTHLAWTDSVGNNRKYFPDFYLPKHNLYLDPKNDYHASQQLEKLQYIQDRHNLVYGRLDYIKEMVLRQGVEP